MATLRAQYNITGRINRRNMLDKHGIYLLKEAFLDLNHTMMKYRTDEGACNVAIEGLPSTDESLESPISFQHNMNSTIYGFSRAIKGRSDGVPCSTKPFLYN